MITPDIKPNCTTTLSIENKLRIASSYQHESIILDQTDSNSFAKLNLKLIMEYLQLLSIVLRYIISISFIILAIIISALNMPVPGLTMLVIGAFSLAFMAYESSNPKKLGEDSYTKNIVISSVVLITCGMLFALISGLGIFSASIIFAGAFLSGIAAAKYKHDHSYSFPPGFKIPWYFSIYSNQEKKEYLEQLAQMRFEDKNSTRIRNYCKPLKMDVLDHLHIEDGSKLTLEKNDEPELVEPDNQLSPP